MATPVIMPRQGQSVESCIIAKWHKQKGDKVVQGDVLFTYETDKATFEEEAKIDGILLSIFFEEGEDVPCLTNVCVIGNEGENAEQFNTNSGSVSEAAVSIASEPIIEKATIEAIPKVETNANLSETNKISPRAKNLAQKQGVDIRYASPTGPNGRVIERDIRALIENGTMVTSAAKDEYLSAALTAEGTGIGGRVSIADLGTATPANLFASNDKDFEEVKHPNIRKVIAKAMHQSLSTMAQLTLNSSFDATEILAFRQMLKTGKEKPDNVNITINDIILFATAKTLLLHKDCNAHYYDDKMLYFRNVHLGVAIDTPRGLMVPTLFNANSKSLNQISVEVKKLANDCQSGTISPDGLKGGTFTITNLGTLGIESFTPVINPPQTCILGVNTLETKVREVNGQPVCYKSMTLSLTFDHRALDGTPAAKFLKDLISNLENFSILLTK